MGATLSGIDEQVLNGFLQCVLKVLFYCKITHELFMQSELSMQSAILVQGALLMQMHFQCIFLENISIVH